MIRFCQTGLAAALLVAGSLFASGAAAQGGTFVHVSDFHFNPFDPSLDGKALAATDIEDWTAHFAALPDQTFSKFGEDTNHALFASATAALAKANPDFAIVTGDLLVHRFQDNAESVLGYPQGSPANNAFAVRTTLFVAEALRATFGGRPVFVSLGNNDSSCGDYRIDPGGTYLAATREAVRSLAGADLVGADFDETYLAGGYYAARHPSQANIDILVLNDVLWSDEYENTCGTGGLAGADAMMAWLQKTLAAARTNGRTVWLVHHIPVGVDAYSTSHSKAATCESRTVPFLKEPFGSTFVSLLAEYGDVVRASFVGHTHFDDYRLLRDGGGKVTGVEKIAPAISPIFGQNPGFHIFSYDRATGAPTDFSTVYLTNLEQAANPAAGDWKTEYTFSKAYGLPGFSPATAETVWQQFSQEGTADDTFRTLYNVGRGELSANVLDAYICAIGHADGPGFNTCHCKS